MKVVLAIILLLSTASVALGNSEEENSPAYYDVINSDTLEEKVTKFTVGPVLIFFGATWCGHCQHFKPVFEEIGLLAQRTHPDLTLYHLDCADLGSREACTKWYLPGYPTLYVAYKGKLCQFKGRRTTESVFQHVEACMAGTAEDIREFPKSRDEYTFWDKFYYGVINFFEKISDLLRERPITAIFVMIGVVAVFLLLLTMFMNWMFDDDYAREQLKRNTELLANKRKAE